MKIVKESLNENTLKPWHYTEDEIFDVAYNLMMNGYLEGWEAADIKSALLYADGETIGDAPYIFTMDEEDEDDEWDDEDEFDESLNENRSRFKSWQDAYAEFMKIADKYFPDEDRIETEIENLNLKYGGSDRNFDEAYRRWCEARDDDDYDESLKFVDNRKNSIIRGDDDPGFDEYDLDYDEPLNENMDNMNRVLKSKVANPVTTFPITMTDAVEKNKELEKKVEDIKKEQEKVFSNKRYFLGAQKQPTPKDVEDPKPLTLDESLFTESSFNVKPVYAQAETIANFIFTFLDSVNRTSRGDYTLQQYLDESDLDLKSLEKDMQNLYEFARICSYGKGEKDWYDFAHMYSQAAGVNEAVKKGSKLTRKSTLPREKDKEGKWDAWTTVMEELVPSSPSTMSVLSKVTKFPDVKRKKRYDPDAVAVDYDGNVEIYADSVDKFDFAKKVADAYNLKVDEPRPRIRGNGFTMKIHMPEAN